MEKLLGDKKVNDEKDYVTSIDKGLQYTIGISINEETPFEIVSVGKTVERTTFNSLRNKRLKDKKVFVFHNKLFVGLIKLEDKYLLERLISNKLLLLKKGIKNITCLYFAVYSESEENLIFNKPNYTLESFVNQLLKE